MDDGCPTGATDGAGRTGPRCGDEEEGVSGQRPRGGPARMMPGKSETKAEPDGPGDPPMSPTLGWGGGGVMHGQYPASWPARASLVVWPASRLPSDLASHLPHRPVQ